MEQKIDNFANSFTKALHDKEPAKTDYLTVLTQELRQALAVTFFIYLAKQALNEPVENKAVEQRIQMFTANKAAELQLDETSLCKFMDIYCDVSKKLQNFWVDLAKDNPNFNHTLSTLENAIFADMKAKDPTIAAYSFTDIRSMLKPNCTPEEKTLANNILQYCRGVIVKTNTTLLNTIKSAVDNGDLTDKTKIETALTATIHQAFDDKTLITKELSEAITAWAGTLNDCKASAAALVTQP